MLYRTDLLHSHVASMRMHDFPVKYCALIREYARRNAIIGRTENALNYKNAIAIADCVCAACTLQPLKSYIELHSAVLWSL